MTSEVGSNDRGQQRDPACPFCRRDDLVIVAETTLFLVVYSKYSIVRGHSLIIPKRHVVSFLALNMHETQELMDFSKTIISAILSTYNTDSFDYALQEGVPAGGTIAHLHFHVIPRIIGDLDQPDDWYPELLKRQFDASAYSDRMLSRDEMLREARSIAEHLK